MFTLLKRLTESLTKTKKYQDDVEQYVASKNPKTIAEVEHWINQYTQSKKGWSL